MEQSATSAWQTTAVQYILQIFSGTGKRFGNDMVHIIIFIFSKPAAKDDLLFPCCIRRILLIQQIVALVIDRVVWLISPFPWS